MKEKKEGKLKEKKEEKVREEEELIEDSMHGMMISQWVRIFGFTFWMDGNFTFLSVAQNLDLLLSFFSVRT